MSGGSREKRIKREKGEKGAKRREGKKGRQGRGVPRKGPGVRSQVTKDSDRKTNFIFLFGVKDSSLPGPGFLSEGLMVRIVIYSVPSSPSIAITL